MVSPLVLCNNILYRAKNDNIPVSPMKLQKLLYFVCRDYVKATKNDLIMESFGVWKYGPVLRSVYDEFKSFHAQPITEYAKDACGESLMLDESYNPQVRQIIDSVWKRYRDSSGIQLSEITHEDGSGWSRAYDQGRTIITKEDMFNDTTN